MNSKVISVFKAMFSKLNIWFEASFAGVLFGKIWSCLAKGFSGSFFHRFFAESKYENIWDNSIFSKVVGALKRALLYLQSKCSKHLDSAVNNSLLCRGISNWSDASVRIYGAFFIPFGVLLAVLSIGNMAALVFSLLALVLGIALFVIDRSVRELAQGSLILKSIGEIFTQLSFEEKERIAATRKHILVSAIAGVVMAALCAVVGVKYFMLGAVGILGIIFLIKYLPLGVFLTVGFSPLLPTMVLVGLSFLCAGVFLLHLLRNGEFKFAKTPMNAVVIFFVIALLWGCINSFDTVSSVRQVLVHLSFILFYFVVVNTIRTKKVWLALVKVFLASAFLVGIYGVIQNFTGVSSTESWVDEEMFTDIKVRVYSFFNNPNVLGEFLVLTIPLTVALIWNRVKEIHKALFTGVLLVLVACMIFTWSRGAWLGMMIAVAIFLAISDKRWIFVGILALLLIPTGLYLSGNSAIVERILSIGNTADTSTAYRVSIWRASIKMLKDFWLSGIGIGSDAYKSVYPVYALTGADFALHSHNLYLQFWVETGVIGIVSLLSLGLGFIKNVFSEEVVKNIKKCDISKLTVAAGAGFIGFLVQGLTDYVWYNYKILMIFWIIIAIGISGSNLLKNKDGGDTP